MPKHGDRAGQGALQAGGELSLGWELARSPKTADPMAAADAKGYAVGPGRRRFLFPTWHKREFRAVALVRRGACAVLAVPSLGHRVCPGGRPGG